MEDNPNFVTINPHNPQQVIIKGSTITFQNGNTYDLEDPDLSYFLCNAQLDTQPQNVNLVYSFLNDMKYNRNYGDEKSKRYYFIDDLNYQNLSRLGSGLNFVFLPSDPDELVDQLKLVTPLIKIYKNDKNNSQFSLEPVEGNPKLFTINPINPQQVIIKNTILTFLSSGNKYTLNDPDLQYCKSNAQLDTQPQNVNLIYSFLNDMKYDINYGDKNQRDSISLTIKSYAK